MTDRAARMRAIHAGARELGLSDDARRDLMERLTGRRSAREMSAAQLGAVLAEYDRLRGRPRRTFRPSTKPLARKVHAMWGDLCRRGVVRAKSSAERRQALRSWCGRQLHPGTDVLLDPDIMDDRDLSALVEALKQWLARLDRAGTKERA